MTQMINSVRLHDWSNQTYIEYITLEDKLENIPQFMGTFADLITLGLQSCGSESDINLGPRIDQSWYFPNFAGSGYKFGSGSLNDFKIFFSSSVLINT